MLGRTDAALVTMLQAIRVVTASTDHRVHFEALGERLDAVCGPGDTAAPVITILVEGGD